MYLGLFGLNALSAVLWGFYLTYISAMCLWQDNAKQTKKIYQSIGISQIFLSFWKGWVDWFDVIYSWQTFVSSYNHFHILKMFIHWLFDSLSNVASGHWMRLWSYSPFLMIDTMLTSLRYFEFFPPPSEVVKDSSNASGIALGESLGSQWWMNLNVFEITKWYWTYPFSVLAFMPFSFKWIAVTFALSESFSWRLKQNGEVWLSLCLLFAVLPIKWWTCTFFSLPLISNAYPYWY